jgi:hypothetical protein
MFPDRSAGLRRLFTITLVLTPVAHVSGACCYFTAEDKDIAQPAQKVFITWDPAQRLESWTVQPKFEGNAADFGMLIPTPSRPKIDEMPRDFFKALAVYTILKNRERPQSKLLPRIVVSSRLYDTGLPPAPGVPRRPPVSVLESGVVGTLDYKIIAAERADELFQWLKDNKYHFAGDEATLDHYLKKKWLFTVMKIDTMQLVRRPDGRFDGEVSPVRFQFTTDQLVYPLKITQLSVRDKTEALFYVQAPFKVDLPGDMSYQYQWTPMLANAQGWYAKGTFGRGSLPGKGDEWLAQIKGKIPDLEQRGRELGFQFVPGKRPEPNADGRIAATLEWAKRLTAEDIKLVRGEAEFSEKLPDVDEGFTSLDLKDPKLQTEVGKVIAERLERSQKERPGGYLIRTAPKKEIESLRLLSGHLQPGQFVTKFRKTFTKSEMADDLLLIPAQMGRATDQSEYEEILPSSPP